MFYPQYPLKRRKLFAYLAIFIVAVVGCVITEYVQKIVSERTVQLQRTEALGVLAQLRSRLESEINSVLYLSGGLISYITVRPDSTAADWRPMAAEIIRESRHVRNIGLAPNNVLSFVYPLRGNENVIGLNYEKTPSQWPAVKEAIDRGGMVLAGPLNLVQGGRGLIARTPIYSRDTEGNKSRYWGLASIVIDVDSLFAAAGIQPRVDDYRIAIIGADGKGLKGGMVMGSRDVIDHGLAQMNVMFPNGHWVISAMPLPDVTPFGIGHDVVRIVAYTFLAVVIVLLLILVRLYHGLHGDAMHDELTGLPNRRLLIEHLNQLGTLHERTGLSFALFFIDLNGFKPVNDVYGHSAGDAVLREVGRRLMLLVRNSDTVARSGGDEFMVLQPAVRSQAALRTVAQKLKDSLSEPYSFRHHKISLSAAIGYAIYPQDADTVDKLIMLADGRMYESKKEYKAKKEPQLFEQEV